MTARNTTHALTVMSDMALRRAVIDVESGGMDAYEAAARLKAAAAPRRCR